MVKYSGQGLKDKAPGVLKMGGLGMQATIGIPRGLLFYEYYPWFKSFLEELGVRVVTSPDTSKAILDRGVQTAVDETCLPVKIFLGHTCSLKDKVDYLFVPRLVSVIPREYTCPKLLGLPDIVKAGIADLPTVIDATLDLSKRTSQAYEFSRRIAGVFRQPSFRAYKAMARANHVLAEYRHLLRSGVPCPKAMAMLELRDSFKTSGEVSAANVVDSRALDEEAMEQEPLKIGLMGHNYLLFDKQIGEGIYNYLGDLGAKIITPDMVTNDCVEEGASFLPKALFWTFEKHVFGATMYLIKSGAVDGLVQCVSFGCGPDSMVGQLIESIAKSSGIPYLQLVIDEHTGEAGIMTRLEAFVDMIKWRQKT